MKLVLGTFYLLGMLVPRKLGYDRSLALHRKRVMAKTVSLGKSLETYSYTKYHPMAEIYEWMSQDSEKFTEVVTQHFLGMTYESRSMYYLKISQPSSSPKKIIWMDCGIHAREWIAPAFCQWFVKEILQNYKDNSRISVFLKNLDFYVLPVLNIDGYIYTWTTDGDISWFICYMIDCGGNPVHPIIMAHVLDQISTEISRYPGVVSTGVSTDCQNITFCGTGPKSEPETKAVADLIETKKEDIVCFLTIHSYGQLILVPYGYTTNKSSNHEELIRVGQKAANALKAKHGTNYRVGSSADILYPTSESSRDWTPDIGIPFSYTFELRDSGTHGFILPEDQIQLTSEEAMEAVLSILEDVHSKYWLSSNARKVTSTSVVLSLMWFFHSVL